MAASQEDRDRLLALVHRRSEEADAHPEAVLGSDATADAEALLAASADIEHDMEVFQAVGYLYWNRYELSDSKSQTDLRLALMYLHPVYMANPEWVPTEARHTLAAAELTDFTLWAYLGSTTLQRSFQQHDLTGMDKGIRLTRMAISQMPADYVSRAATYANLGSALATRYHIHDQPSDLDEAIAMMEKAVAAARTNDPHKARMQQTLAQLQQEQASAPTAAEQLQAKIDERRRMLAESSHDDPDRPAMESDLAKFLGLRYQVAGRVEDLDEAITCGTRAVESFPSEDPRGRTAVSGLVAGLGLRYQRFGHAEDLERSIKLAQEELAGPDTEPTLARIALLSDLGQALRLRFERFGETGDLNDSVDLAREVSAQRSDFRSREALSNLCNILCQRFELYRDPTDAREAVDAGRASVDGIPDNHQSRGGCLSNLGRAYLSLWEAEHDQHDIEDAVRTLRQAVAATPAETPDIGGRIGGLAVALTMLASTQEDGTAALEEALRLHTAALADTSHDDVDRARRLINMGQTLRILSVKTGDEDKGLDALAHFEEASRQVLATTSVRVSAAAWAGEMAASLGRMQQAADDFAAAVELLPLVASPALQRNDAQRWLASFAGLASAAMSCAVQAGDPERALALFETGRGVLLSRVLDADEDQATLAAADPQAARRLEELRQEMDGAADPTESRIVLAERRRQAADELQALIEEVRSRPGLAGFMAVPDTTELLGAAKGGDVVVVNASRWGSHALLLHENLLQVVPLPDLSADQAGDRANAFLAAIDVINSDQSSLDDQVSAQGRVGDTLSWLWDCVGRPVFDTLGTRTTDTSELPRVWWVPSGAMTVFPLGMAGRYNPADQTSQPDQLQRDEPGRPGESVPDRAVSSYSPTLRALLNIRSRSEASSADTVNLLGVAMPHTQGQPDLPGTEREMDMLRKRFEGCTVLQGEQATLQAVTEALHSANWAHFACHGISDPYQPQQSKLLLQDYQEHPLTMVELSQLNLDQADLAFLSACSTGVTSPGLADEAVHITGGCLLAGFRSVIGTLWTIDDDVAVEIAGKVYDSMARGGAAAAPAALHDALTSVRARYPLSPSLWAAHVHVGA